jgi:hypothetical protein
MSKSKSDIQNIVQRNLIKAGKLKPTTPEQAITKEVSEILSTPLPADHGTGRVSALKGKILLAALNKPRKDSKTQKRKKNLEAHKRGIHSHV